MNPIVLLDLDGNVVYNTRKFRKYVGDETVLGTVCERDENDEPRSFQSQAQKAYLNWLLYSTTVVPITGRTSASYRRLTLGLKGHAITCFGATILDGNGRPNIEWTSRMAMKADIETPALRRLNRVIESRRVGANTHSRIVDENMMQLYIKVWDTNGNQDNIDATAEIIRAHMPEDWRLHLNENQLCVCPPFLNKRDAAVFYLQNIANHHQLVLGSGDSKSDLDFMSICHFMIAPTQSQIFNSLIESV